MSRHSLRNVELEQAIAAIMAAAPSARPERVGAGEALGRTLAQELVALADHPSADVSAMDGYACRSEETVIASEVGPQRLRVVGEAAAGVPFGSALETGEAVAISTGAQLPEGSDGIALLEETRREGDDVLLFRPAARKHVRRKGEDLRRGRSYLGAGIELDPLRLSMAAALGHDSVVVAGRPRVAVLVTGQELTEPGSAAARDQVFDSNGPLLEALLRSMGADPHLIPRIGDDVAELRTTVGSSRADLIVTTGGASVGRHDSVRRLLEEEGEVIFPRIAVRPGGPTMFARWRQMDILALPGNPVAAAVLGAILLDAWCHRALQRAGEPTCLVRLTAVASTAFRSVDDTTCLWLAHLDNDEAGRLIVSVVEPQGSARVAAMQESNSVVIVPPGCASDAGSPVSVIPLTALGRGAEARPTGPGR